MWEVCLRAYACGACVMYVRACTVVMNMPSYNIPCSSACAATHGAIRYSVLCPRLHSPSSFFRACTLHGHQRDTSVLMLSRFLCLLGIPLFKVSPMCSHLLCYRFIPCLCVSSFYLASLSPMVDGRWLVGNRSVLPCAPNVRRLCSLALACFIVMRFRKL